MPSLNTAVKEKDHASFEMLQWFVKEQVEEEENASAILAQINIVGDVPGPLFVSITRWKAGITTPSLFYGFVPVQCFFNVTVTDFLMTAGNSCYYTQ